MILIFGGTTEGRVAAEVCEVAGKPYYYSTRSAMQDVELHNGVRLSGALTLSDIMSFCSANGVRCIIDAAHPFAEHLHHTIDQTHLPVIRLQRHFGDKVDEAVYCNDYADAMRQMEKSGVNRLLVLSGANTISKLQPWWSEHPSVFRILHREESITVAKRCGLPMENVIFYNDALQLPTKEEEQDMMRPAGCDAMITKESGENGGFRNKVQAALSLGMKVFVVKHPPLPSHWHYVTGPHSLRRAIEHTVPEFFPLHTGLTTGACATAATKAALLSLLYGERVEEVSFALPDDEVMTVPVELEGIGRASVVKDQSDDPDVTKGCRITSVVARNGCGTIRFLQGDGVGTVTLPGLGIPMGGPAINVTPRRMMEREIRALSDEGFDVTISVADGAALAQKTFNPKVGVVGGISIIGTSGIVSPLSNEAFIQSIGRELEVARAIGCTEIGIVAGKKSEEFLQRLYPKLRMIHYGNFVGETLKKARALSFERVVVGIMIGKAVKLAEGNLDTHSHKVVMNKAFLKDLVVSMAADGILDAVADANENQRLAETYIREINNITMARELTSFMPPSFFSRIETLCHNHCQKVFPDGEIKIILICDGQV